MTAAIHLKVGVRGVPRRTCRWSKGAQLPAHAGLVLPALLIPVQSCMGYTYRASAKCLPVINLACRVPMCCTSATVLEPGGLHVDNAGQRCHKCPGWQSAFHFRKATWKAVEPTCRAVEARCAPMLMQTATCAGKQSVGIGAAHLHLLAQNRLPVVAWMHSVCRGAAHLRLRRSWPQRGSCQSPPAQPRPPQWQLHRPPAPSQLHDKASTKRQVWACTPVRARQQGCAPECRQDKVRVSPAVKRRCSVF